MSLSRRETRDQGQGYLGGQSYHEIRFEFCEEAKKEKEREKQRDRGEKGEKKKERGGGREIERERERKSLRHDTLYVRIRQRLARTTTTIIRATWARSFSAGTSPSIFNFRAFCFSLSLSLSLSLVPTVSLPIMRSAVSVNSTRYTGRLIPTERNCESYSRSKYRRVRHAFTRPESIDQLPAFPRIQWYLLNYSLRNVCSSTNYPLSSLLSLLFSLKSLFQYRFKYPW